MGARLIEADVAVVGRRRRRPRRSTEARCRRPRRRRPRGARSRRRSLSGTRRSAARRTSSEASGSRRTSRGCTRCSPSSGSSSSRRTATATTSTSTSPGRAHRHAGDDTASRSAEERALEEADAKLDALAKELDPEAPWEHPRARELDTITFDEWLRAEVGGRGRAREPRARTSPTASSRSRRTRSRFSRGCGRSRAREGRTSSSRPSSASRTASSAARSSFRSGWPRSSASASCSMPRSARSGGRTQGGRRRGGVRVKARAADRRRSARISQAAIRFSPALPAWRMRLQQASSQGSVTKILAVYPEPFWRADGLSGEGFAPHQLVRELYDNTPPSASVGRPLHVPPRRAGRVRRAPEPGPRAGSSSSRAWPSSSARRRCRRRTTSRRTGRRRSGRGVRTHRRSASVVSRASAPTCVGPSARSTGRAPTSRDVGHMHMEGGVRSGEAAADAILDIG